MQLTEFVLTYTDTCPVTYASSGEKGFRTLRTRDAAMLSVVDNTE
jgi:hypothetical protein